MQNKELGRVDQPRMAREIAFHDDWARSSRLNWTNVKNCFEAPTAVENKVILRLMGPLAGKRMLDVGAGLGESSVYFAMQGASVTTTDISPEMVRTAVELGRIQGVEIEGVVSSGEELNVEPGVYDIVYIANTIHHVTDKDALFAQIRRALKPGGRFFSFDPIAYNPAIAIYRRMATDVRTVDEKPLRLADLKLAKRYFINVQHREFWILGLTLFFKYYFIDRIHPNEDRYWKRILRETPQSLWWWMPLQMLDTILTRVPLIRWLSWNMVMWGENP